VHTGVDLDVDPGWPTGLGGRAGERLDRLGVEDGQLDARLEHRRVEAIGRGTDNEHGDAEGHGLQGLGG